MKLYLVMIMLARRGSLVCDARLHEGSTEVEAIATAKRILLANENGCFTEADVNQEIAEDVTQIAFNFTNYYG